LCRTPDPVFRHAVRARRQEAHNFVHALVSCPIIKLGCSAYELTDLEGVRDQTLLSIQGDWIVEADEQGAEAADTADPIRALTISPLHLFANWPTGDVPRSGAVVYTIWNQESDLTGWNWTRLIERIDLDPRRNPCRRRGSPQNRLLPSFARLRCNSPKARASRLPARTPPSQNRAQGRVPEAGDLLQPQGSSGHHRRLA
jgi:hypothetical protein